MTDYDATPRYTALYIIGEIQTSRTELLGNARIQYLAISHSNWLLLKANTRIQARDEIGKSTKRCSVEK